MVIQAEQDRVKHLLSEALPMLCKSGLSFSSEFCIEALIGITLDKNDVFLVSIKETIKSDSGNEDSLEKTTDISITRVDDDTENLLTPRSHRKRRHSKSSRISDSESDNEVDEVTIKREKLSSMEQEDGSENSFETSTSSQRNYTTTGTQGTASVFVKQEPNMTDSINVEQAVENFNITGFTQDEGESNLGNQAIVKPVQSFSHDQAVSGLGRSAGMPPEIHAAEDTGQESDSINTTSATGLAPLMMPSQDLPTITADHPLNAQTSELKSSINLQGWMYHELLNNAVSIMNNTYSCETTKPNINTHGLVSIVDDTYNEKTKTNTQVLGHASDGESSHSIATGVALDSIVNAGASSNLCIGNKSQDPYATVIEHVAPGKWMCLMCRQLFTRNSTLRMHINVVHLKERRFQCSNCPAKFGKKFNMTVHERNCRKKVGNEGYDTWLYRKKE